MSCSSFLFFIFQFFIISTVGKCPTVWHCRFSWFFFRFKPSVMQISSLGCCFWIAQCQCLVSLYLSQSNSSRDWISFSDTVHLFDCRMEWAPGLREALPFHHRERQHPDGWPAPHLLPPLRDSHGRCRIKVGGTSIVSFWTKRTNFLHNASITEEWKRMPSWFPVTCSPIC